MPIRVPRRDLSLYEDGKTDRRQGGEDAQEEATNRRHDDDAGFRVVAIVQK